MALSRRQFLAAAGAAMALPRAAYGRAPYPAERIAPMVMVGFEGTSSTDNGAQQLAELVAENRVGGVCFVYGNVTSRPGVESLTQLFHSAADRWPLLTAIDQEGGQVQRLSSRLGYGNEPAPISVATSFDVPTARRTYGAMAAEMRGAGFNLNLAPVVDLGFEARNPAITALGRSFGAEPGTVIKYSRAFLAGHRDAGVLTALKHFPGHGSSLADSHDGIADVTKTWRESELNPYASLVREGAVELVMTGHISHKDLTGGLPASLSIDAIDGLLRKRVGYDGVVITDDLQMAAVRKGYSLEDSAIKAAAAGNDILLFTNVQSESGLPIRIIRAIQQGIQDGRLSPDRIEASVARIQRMKRGLMQMALLPKQPREL